MAKNRIFIHLLDTNIYKELSKKYCVSAIILKRQSHQNVSVFLVAEQLNTQFYQCVCVCVLHKNESKNKIKLQENTKKIIEIRIDKNK